VNDEGRLDPEYAEIYGVPFAFIPGRPVKESPPRPPAVEVYALSDRTDLRITFPKLDGYRREVPDERFDPVFDESSRLHLTQSTVATWTKTHGIVGESDEQVLDRYRDAREQEVAYRIARLLVRDTFRVYDDVPRPWLFPQLVQISRDWLQGYVTVDANTTIGMLLLQEGTHRAVESLEKADWKVDGNRTPVLLPILRPFDPEGSTDDVHFFTRKVVIDATKSHINRVVLDGPGGNTWEQAVSSLLERHPQVAAYVKNDHLGFTIPYVHEGRTYQYVPDFLVRLTAGPKDPTRTLIIEVSGGLKSAHSPGPVKAKADTTRYQWCTAVNNHGGYGQWDYLEIKKIDTAAARLDAAIQSLHADGLSTGLPTLADGLLNGSPSGGE
jgi:type III restriction enzyme